jgi:hypothetical protein
MAHFAMEIATRQRAIAAHGNFLLLLSISVWLQTAFFGEEAEQHLLA